MWQTQFPPLFFLLFNFHSFNRRDFVYTWFRSYHYWIERKKLCIWIFIFTIYNSFCDRGVCEKNRRRESNALRGYGEINATTINDPHGEFNNSNSNETSLMMWKKLLMVYNLYRIESNKIQCLLIASSHLSANSSEIEYKITSETHQKIQWKVVDVTDVCRYTFPLVFISKYNL